MKYDESKNLDHEDWYTFMSTSWAHSQSEKKAVHM